MRNMNRELPQQHGEDANFVRPIIDLDHVDSSSIRAESIDPCPPGAPLVESAFFTGPGSRQLKPARSQEDQARIDKIQRTLRVLRVE